MSATATGGHDRRIDLPRRGPRVPARLLRLASDERLVDALRGGSDAAFEVMYTRHHRGVLSFCRHMLGSAEEAEDAVQHTYLAAYRDLLRSDKPIRLRPWLYTIARNRCLSVLRARRERATGEPLEPSTEHLAQEVERRDDLRAVLGDLAALPDEQRAALVLAELGDMSHDDIAHVLGCPREKVKALVFQARTSLIASRTARETPCTEVREQLANLRGGSLRRNTLRRHLRECPGCRDYRNQVRAQRSSLALIIPVVPSLGLKATVLGAAGVTAAGGGSAAVVATGVVALCAVGGGTAVVEVSRDDDRPRDRPARVAPPARAQPPAASDQRPVVLPAASDRSAAAKPVVVQSATRPKRIRARGPKPKAAEPVRARGPELKVAKPVRARGPELKAAKPVPVPGPKPKAAKRAEPPRAATPPPAAATRPPKAARAKPPKPVAPPPAAKPAKPDKSGKS
jgi:RNA polymerase sigma factor (sigma-70 family)